MGFLGPVILYEFGKHTSADTLCYDIRICYVDQGKSMCNLFPLPDAANEVSPRPSTPVRGQ